MVQIKWEVENQMKKRMSRKVSKDYDINNIGACVWFSQKEQANIIVKHSADIRNKDDQIDVDQFS